MEKGRTCFVMFNYLVNSNRNPISVRSAVSGMFQQQKIFLGESLNISLYVTFQNTKRDTFIQYIASTSGDNESKRIWH